MGEYEYSGTISASVDFEYFPFTVSDTSKNTEDILNSIVSPGEEWKILKELSKLDIHEDVLHRPFSTLSNGEQTKVLLAGLFLRENSFLLIDEPTNHLDMEGRETVARYLNQKKGFILVSHDRAFLDDCVDHILSINKANIEIQKGNFSSWWLNKKKQDEYEIAENEKLEKDIKRLKQAARQNDDWANSAENLKRGKGAAKLRKKGQYGMGTAPYFGEKSRKKQQLRKNLINRQNKAIEDKSSLLKNIESAENLKIHPLKYHSSGLISFEDVAVVYDNRTIFSDLSFTLLYGERLAVVGGNGSGKSTVLKIICGESVPYTGKINIGNRLIISYVPQDASFLEGSLDEYAENRQIDVTLFKTILRKLDFARIQFEKDMSDYSAGQKKKVLLAASLCEEAHVYIWDEPLNYIDVLSRIQIESLITTFKPTMIFVEHDRVFCENIGTKFVRL
jgi:lincosamide and streptogramin A transport system ATP-binding/permease protein